MNNQLNKRMNYFYCLMICSCLVSFVASCKKEDKISDVSPVASGTVADKEGILYDWVQIGDQQWTMVNARSGTPFFRLLEPPYFTSRLISVGDTLEVKRFYNEYGNLYAFEDALALAPEGWHLPTDEDWMILEKNLGMSDTEAQRIGWRGQHMDELLLPSESASQLGLKMGGLVLKKGRPFWLSYTYFKDYGYYWTSTVEEETPSGKHVYFRKLVVGGDQIGRYVTNSNELFMSVRYVKNIK